MKDRSTESLRAAQRLLEGEEPCPCSAVSRAYYAAYQWCVGQLLELGEGPPGRYWRHDLLPDAAAEELKLGDRAADLSYLMSQRVRADYYRDPMTAEDAQACLRTAAGLIQEVRSLWKS